MAVINCRIKVWSVDRFLTVLLLLGIYQNIGEMSSEYTDDLRNVYTALEQNIKINEEKIQSQHRIYNELYRIFLKHANKVATVANSINEQILDSANQEDMTVQYYQVLSNSLLRLADSSRRVSLRLKSQILDPLKTFSENYDNVYEDFRKQFETKMFQLSQQEAETQKHREHYNSACEKFEKHRQTQKRVMEKIESGSKSQLEKFNQNTKKLTQNITSNEKFYLSSVQKMNYDLENSKKEFAILNQSISYNEDTRRSFFRKTILNSIKTFQQFTAAYDPQIIKKLEESAKLEAPKFEDPHQKRIRLQLERVINNDHRQQFVCYEDLMKNRRKRTTEEDNSHLTQYFSKLKDREKKDIRQLLDQWFGTTTARKTSEMLEDISLNKSKSSSKLSSSSASEVGETKSQRNSEKKMEQTDMIKEKIISVLPHSLFFLELLYGRILEMTSFYCKVSEDNFLFLLNAFSIITKNIDTNSDIGIEFTYKMMIISQRIMLKKNFVNKQANQPIELLCIKYCKNVSKFRDPKFLNKLLNYIERRKTLKKKINAESKGALNIAKGFLAAFSRGKGPSLNEDEQYNCLQEMIMIMSNFSVPNEVILPFIKQALGNTHQSSYEYLKNIILAKKDVEERRSLFYRKEIKEKKEELMKKAIENKKKGEYVLKIVAEHGYFGMEGLEYRTICKELKNIHLDILPRIKNLPSEKKWIRLIPVDKKMDYIQMKQEVAENSVPSAIEQIITLDVNRSLHLHGESLNPTILHSLLRTYAYFHVEISYCQGMNYLAGYLYIKTKNQEYTYRIFENLMEYRFKQIFINEFEVLKVKMYQFERLLAIFHPQISQHFKRQSITPECYIVSWIITLFASSYQYTMSSYLIDVLWQRFIIWGWPEFFRFVLWIFSQYKEDLVELTYDKALHFLGQLGRSQLFLSDYQKYHEKFAEKLGNPIEGMDRYPVSEELLLKFTNEYKLDQ